MLVLVFVGDGLQEVAVVVSLCRPCLMRLIGFEGMESIAGLRWCVMARESGGRRRTKRKLGRRN